MLRDKIIRLAASEPAESPFKALLLGVLREASRGNEVQVGSWTVGKFETAREATARDFVAELVEQGLDEVPGFISEPRPSPAGSRLDSDAFAANWEYRALLKQRILKPGEVGVSSFRTFGGNGQLYHVWYVR